MPIHKMMILNIRQIGGITVVTHAAETPKVNNGIKMRSLRGAAAMLGILISVVANKMVETIMGVCICFASKSLSVNRVYDSQRSIRHAMIMANAHKKRVKPVPLPANNTW